VSPRHDAAETSNCELSPTMSPLTEPREAVARGGPSVARLARRRTNRRPTGGPDESARRWNKPSPSTTRHLRALAGTDRIDSVRIRRSKCACRRLATSPSYHSLAAQLLGYFAVPATGRLPFYAPRPTTLVIEALRNTPTPGADCDRRRCPVGLHRLRLRLTPRPQGVILDLPATAIPYFSHAA